MHRPSRAGTRIRHAVTALACIAGGLLACTSTALQNFTSPTSNLILPFGQQTPRAIIVGFVNNTPFRAIFTFGGYNTLDDDSVPTLFGQLRLEGNTSSAQLNQPCRKVFSVGGDELIRLIELNSNSPTINVNDPDALIRGVNFSSAPANDPLAAEPTEGTAVGLDRLVGVDFTCERTSSQQATGTGLLIFTFEQDAMAPGGFRIDYMFIPQ